MRTGLCIAFLAFAFRPPSDGFISKSDAQDPSEDCHLVTSKDLHDPKAPRLASYSTRESETVVHPKVDLRSAENGRLFRTRLREGARKGPNFAGHYRVVVWGCGTSCANFAVINLITGKIIETEGFQAIDGVNFEVQDFIPHTDSVETSFRYKKNSRLLVVLGAQDEDSSRAGAFYYVVENERLVLIHSTTVEKNCD